MILLGALVLQKAMGLSHEATWEAFVDIYLDGEVMVRSRRRASQRCSIRMASRLDLSLW